MAKKQMAMVVDDNQLFGDLVSRMLIKLGYNTFVCADFESAMDFVGKSRIALLIADIYMPGMGGIEGIRKMRDVLPSTHIIAISGGWQGMSAENTVAAAKKVGADACLEKPFTAKDLEAVLNTLATP